MLLEGNVCKTCFGELTKRSVRKQKEPPRPKFSPKSSFDFGIQVPECLQNLTFAEEALISMVQICIFLSVLSNGTRSLKGPVSFINRFDSISAIAERLPWSVKSINWLALCREIPKGNGDYKVKEFRCRRENVKNALAFCIRYHAPYEKIKTQTREVWDEIPVDGYIDPHLLVDPALETLVNDLGPAPEQNKSDVTTSDKNNIWDSDDDVENVDDNLDSDCQGFIEENLLTKGLVN